MTELIYLIQIGPVQPFIASARKVQDLAVGSALLSQLARAGVETAITNSATMIFPVPDESSQLPANVPHRFAFTSHTPNIAKIVSQAIRDKWGEFTDAVRQLLQNSVSSDSWQAIYDAQIQQFPTIIWAAVPYDEKKHSESYKKVNLALTARKQFREFAQVDTVEVGYGTKCTQSGSQLALPIDCTQLDKKLSSGEGILFRDNEMLGAIAIIKRLLPYTNFNRQEKAFQKGFTDVTTIAGTSRDADMLDGRESERYFAVLHMDGDKMGKKLSKLTKREEHQKFSRVLNRFASHSVPAITGEFNSRVSEDEQDRVVLIYAGGDDVLALAPVDIVLQYAESLRREFVHQMQKAFKDINEVAPETLHASAGISINYVMSPLDIALENARSAEHTAKTHFGRNAITIRETTHSGNIRDVSGKWVDIAPDNPSNVVAFMVLLDNLRELMQQNKLSTKLGYDLQELANDMVELEATLAPMSESERGNFKATLKDARHAECRRLLKRRLSDALTKQEKLDMINELAPQLTQLGESVYCGWYALANRVIMARFLSQADTVEERV